MDIKSMLDQEHKNELELIKKVENTFNQIRASYKFHHVTLNKHWINNTRASIHFNGITRLYIDGQKLYLSGPGLRSHPNAKLSPIPGCGDEGTIETTELTVIVNALAKYEKIFPN